MHRLKVLVVGTEALSRTQYTCLATAHLCARTCRQHAAVRRIHKDACTSAWWLHL